MHTLENRKTGTFVEDSLDVRLTAIDQKLILDVFG